MKKPVYQPWDLCFGGNGLCRDIPVSGSYHPWKTFIFYYGFRDVLTLILGGGILAVFMGAIAYPLYYWWGEEKTEIIIALAILGAVAGDPGPQHADQFPDRGRGRDRYPILYQPGSDPPYCRSRLCRFLFPVRPDL